MIQPAIDSAFDAPLPIVCAFMAAVGALIGSFLNVVIHRIPREQSIVLPSSKCPKCRAEIKPYDNIPVLSWLLLRGKCRHCKAPISPRYAAVELLTGVFFVLSYLMEGDALAPALKYCTLSFLLIGLVFTDAETQLLPDLLTKPGILLGLVFGWFVPVDGPAGFLLRNADDFTGFVKENGARRSSSLIQR